MQQRRLMMGMPITISVVDTEVNTIDINDVFSYFQEVDRQFSPYKIRSEVSRLNRKEIRENDASEEMREILALSEQTKNETEGYFDVYRNGYFDPSGIVKGWAIQKAAGLLHNKGFTNFFIDAGGDIQVSGRNNEGAAWRVGIKHPTLQSEIVKVLGVESEGVATSGTYLRGEHIYDPHHNFVPITEIVSLTVVGPSIYEADRFATAAFAMGKNGITFIEKQKNLEGYMIDKNGVATATSNFDTYVVS